MTTLRSDTAALAENNTVILSFANSDYLPVIENWINALNHLNIKNYIVICLDQEVYDHLLQQGNPVLLRPCINELGSLWVHRIDVIKEFLDVGFNVLHSDADAVWLKNPLGKYIYNQPDDMIFSQGTVWPPDIHEKWQFVLCCGLFYVKSNLAVLNFFELLAIRVREDKDDQVSINRMLYEASIKWEIGDSYLLPFREKEFICSDEIIKGKNSALSIAVLPHRKFQRLCEESDDIYVKHILSQKNSTDILDTLKANNCLVSAFQDK